MNQTNQSSSILPITVIMGLGNPGSAYANTRHNIGFKIVDELACRYHGTWRTKDMMDQATVMIHNRPILLVKPLTSMNVSGNVLPTLFKRGIKPEQILVVHDELELPFGKMVIKIGGSHKGHNGVRSIIAAGGAQSPRLHFGIGRPDRKEDVPNYVLQPFDQDRSKLEAAINQAADMIENILTE